MKEIPVVVHMFLSNSDKLMKIDWSDFQRLAPYRNTLYLNRDGYVYLKKFSTSKVHRFVMMAGDTPLYVDHINRDPLDNRKVNLRFATPSQNSMNRKPKNKYKGVNLRKDKKGKPWQAQCRDPVSKKVLHLGYYSTPEEAAKAYNQYILKSRNPQYCYLNEV